MTVDTTGLVGTTTIFVTGVLPNGQFFDAYFKLVGAVVLPPTFASSLNPQDIPLNTRYEYILPAITTAEGSTATFRIDPLYQDGVTPAFAFVLNSPDVPNNKLILHPTKFSDVGQHNFNVKLSNGFDFTTYPLTITVTNTQPTFDMSTPG